MKTSIKLLCLLAVIALTGMVSIDLLLKEQYEKIDWSNPYQNFIRKPLPALRHVRIMGIPDHQVLIRQNPESFLLIEPDSRQAQLQTSQKGDTLVVDFSSPKYNWQSSMYEPWGEWDKNQADIVLNLPVLNSLDATFGKVVLDGFTADTMTLTCRRALLKTKHIQVQSTLFVQMQSGSRAWLDADRCGTLVVTARDSAMVSLEAIKPARLVPTIAPKAELHLRGEQLQGIRAL
ncbi:MAG: hypothetical protein EAZ91_20230 [Cytophagales bacterium]|nr:MAG: hypothetical protein EAZ91_20230 [Cytophagales bacterium]